MPGPSSPPRDASSTSLGDPRTVDPCTLVNPSTLGSFGQVSNAGTVSLDYCLLHVQAPNGALVQLAVGELGAAEGHDAADGQPVIQRGPLRIVQDAPIPGHCSRQVVFTDRVAMSVNADLLTGEPGAGLCSIAEAGANQAAATIEQHRVGHRQFPANSLTMVDACSVMDSVAVHEIPGLEQAQPQPKPAGHQCRWGEQAPDAPRVQLVHTAGAPPRVLHGAAVEQQIAGRRTVVSVVGGNPRTPLCSAETAHIPFGPPESGQVEVAMLVVVSPGTNGIHACELARGLAERTWPHLPPS